MSLKSFTNSTYLYRTILFAINFLNEILYSILDRYIKKTIIKNEYDIKRENCYKNKIVYIIPSLGFGGAERQLTNLVNHIIKPTYKKYHGEIEVSIVCFDTKGFSNDFYISQIAPQIRIVNLGESIDLKVFLEELRKNLKFFWLGKNLVYLNRLADFVDVEKPRILHAWLDTPSVCGGIVGILKGVPNIILSSRSINPKNYLFNRFYHKSVYQKLNDYQQVTFLNNSSAGALSYEKWLNFKNGRIKVINNGFEIEKLRNFQAHINTNKNLNHVIIGGVMRFNYEKNVGLWIQTAYFLSKTKIPIKFVIIGDGPGLLNVKRKINKLGLSGVITIINPTNKIYAHMSKFDVLLLTSRYEGLPNVLIEAQLLGIPVVSTNCGGASETFVDNLSGLLIKKNDPKLIADSLSSLLINKNMLEEFSVYAIKQAVPRFDMSIIAEKYLTIYDKI